MHSSSRYGIGEPHGAFETLFHNRCWRTEMNNSGRDSMELGLKPVRRGNKGEMNWHAPSASTSMRKFRYNPGSTERWPRG